MKSFGRHELDFFFQESIFVTKLVFVERGAPAYRRIGNHLCSNVKPVAYQLIVKTTAREREEPILRILRFVRLM